MKPLSTIGFATAATTLALVLGAAPALARIPTNCRANLAPPSQCVGRNATGYTAGVGQGVSLVDQIWESPEVGQNPDQWELLQERVTSTIPTTVATVYQTTWNDYLTCRTQGLLDGSVCRMNEIDPIPGCQLDGTDWGKMSATLYCMLSIDMGGLGDVVPWFIRPAPGMCGNGFQTYCESVYHYGATDGGVPLPAEVLTFLLGQGVDPASFLQPVECVPYTAEAYAGVFEDSVYVDCSYTIPSTGG